MSLLARFWECSPATRRRLQEYGLLDRDELVTEKGIEVLLAEHELDGLGSYDRLLASVNPRDKARLKAFVYFGCLTNEEPIKLTPRGLRLVQGTVCSAGFGADAANEIDNRPAELKRHPGAF